MRKTTLAALLTLSLLAAPPPSSAQGEETEAEGEEAAGGETEGAEVIDQEGDQVAVPPAAGGREAAPGEVHTVAKGDTLWDLSQRFLGSPWYWPKVWSYNPEIANPHWIYPGNLVRFFPSGEEVPSRVEVGTGPAPEPVDDGMESPQEIPAELVQDDVQVVGRIGYVAPKSRRIVHEGFVTPRELEESGVIASSFSEPTMLSFPDKVYVKFKNRTEAKVGDRYVIYRTQNEVRHPTKGGRYGYVTRFLGVMRIVAVGEKVATGQIGETWDEVNRGDLVGPFGERLAENVAARPNERELDGRLIGTLVPELSLVGEHHFVIIDKGSAEGVQPGNTFTVVRQGDALQSNFEEPWRDQDKRLPVEDIGRCMAVDVKEKASTCLVTRSLRELVVGDRVLMRVEGSTTAKLQ